mmetsp:Transcript_12951/g.31738  ORF Transcript_12951/g.31738 Transcript_12951/m.31738 type:complete len:352 (-) Transcript_12951:458-1513(-)
MPHTTASDLVSYASYISRGSSGESKPLRGRVSKKTKKNSVQNLQKALPPSHHSVRRLLRIALFATVVATLVLTLLAVFSVQFRLSRSQLPAAASLVEMQDGADNQSPTSHLRENSAVGGAIGDSVETERKLFAFDPVAPVKEFFGVVWNSMSSVGNWALQGMVLAFHSCTHFFLFVGRIFMTGIYAIGSFFTGAFRATCHFFIWFWHGTVSVFMFAWNGVCAGSLGLYHWFGSFFGRLVGDYHYSPHSKPGPGPEPVPSGSSKTSNDTSANPTRAPTPEPTEAPSKKQEPSKPTPPPSVAVPPAGAQPPAPGTPPNPPPPAAAGAATALPPGAPATAAAPPANPAPPVPQA